MKCSRCHKKTKTLLVFGLNVAKDAMIKLRVCVDCISGGDVIIDGYCRECVKNTIIKSSPELFRQGYLGRPVGLDCEFYERGVTCDEMNMKILEHYKKTMGKEDDAGG